MGKVVFGFKAGPGPQMHAESQPCVNGGPLVNLPFFCLGAGGVICRV